MIGTITRLRILSGLLALCLTLGQAVAAPSVTGDCRGGTSATIANGQYASGEGINCGTTGTLTWENASMQSGVAINLSGQTVRILPTSALTATFRANTAITEPNGDLDGDGMPNGFEVAYGLAPADPGDAVIDADGDGVSNVQEYQDGTDPTDYHDYAGYSPYHTPAGLADTLQQTRPVTWTALVSAPADLLRFAFGEVGTSSLFVVEDDATSVTAPVAIDATLASESIASNDRLLRTIFQLIEESSGVYRIVPAKHFNYALDVDPGNAYRLIVRDVRSGFLDTANAAYLLFSLTSQNDGYRLTAVGRKVYEGTSSAFVTDPSWTSKTLTRSGDQLLLSESSDVALALYTPPLDLEIPFDFNPSQTARVSNPEVTPQTKGDDPLATLAGKVVSRYGAQVAARGLDDATTAAAAAMLDTIANDLAGEGASLRYSKAFYLALRAGLLTRTSHSSDATDIPLGELTVPYVYFTNETDGNGVHHPFMVIASYGVPEGMALLWDVAKPPGDGLTGDYNTQSVTRSYHHEAHMVKVPLRDYGEVGSLTENIMANSLADDVNYLPYDHHNYASISATGIAVDGIIIYPAYNNMLHFTQADAEISAQGMHSGRGLGVHYHADAHAAAHSGLNLYNDEDYVGLSHPPIVSIGFDGVAGYGVYAADDTTSDGAQVALDAFGGHEHGDYNYHYHAFAKQETVGSATPYVVHTLPPQGAWAGRINDIPEFWNGTAPSYVGGNSVYLGTQ